MKKLAVCFYGHESETQAHLDLVFEKFKEFNISIFSSNAEDKLTALQEAAHKKHTSEILQKHNYDVCLAIDTSSIDLLYYTTINNIENNFVYFTKGFFKRNTVSTGVSTEIFYASSLTFDRACEMKINSEYIDIEWLRGRDSAELFYYHLKSLNIRTECINRENSNMFIRTA